MNTLALCIPAYNAAAYLPRLLASATNQQIPFSEVFVYDDCSSDNTGEVAMSFGATVIRGDVNRGCSFGKNALAQRTSCDWIHFHDADDELLPNFTTLAHKWMSRIDCPDVVLFDYEYRDNDTFQLFSIKHFDSQRLAEDALKYAISEQINPFCGLYRKSEYLKIGGYDIDPLILYNEDKAFHIKLAKNGLSFSAESEVSIINYRIGNSMSASNNQKCILAQYHVLENIASTHGNQYPNEISGQLWECIPRLAATQNWQYVKRALKLSKKLGHPSTSTGNSKFKSLTKLWPLGAVWLREKLIRIFKSHLRS